MSLVSCTSGSPLVGLLGSISFTQAKHRGVFGKSAHEAVEFTLDTDGGGRELLAEIRCDHGSFSFRDNVLVAGEGAEGETDSTSTGILLPHPAPCEATDELNRKATSEPLRPPSTSIPNRTGIESDSDRNQPERGHWAGAASAFSCTITPNRAGIPFRRIDSLNESVERVQRKRCSALWPDVI